MTEKQSLWQLVDHLDKGLRSTINELRSKEEYLAEAIRPVVGHRYPVDQEKENEFWVLSDLRSRGEHSRTFRKASDSNPMPKLWNPSAANFRAVIDHLFDEKEDRDLLNYFAILLKLDHDVLGDVGMNFTFAAFEKNPVRCEKDLYDYALEEPALPNTEILFGEGEREPLCYWVGPTMDSARSLRDRYADKISGRHFHASCGDGTYVLEKSDEKSLIKKIKETDKRWVLEGRELLSVKETFMAYWRHITGSDDSATNRRAMRENSFGAVFVPVSSSHEESAGAVFLLFSDFVKLQRTHSASPENDISTNQKLTPAIGFNPRKVVAAGLIIRGPFDSWQNRLETIRDTSFNAKKAMIGMFGHEVKNLAEALGGRWSIPCSSTQLAVSESEAESWRIIQFPELYIYAQRLLKLWAMTCSPEDLPRNSVGNLEELAELAMQRAIESWTIEQTIDAPNTETISNILERAKSINCRSLFDFSGTELVEINWRTVKSGDETSVRQFFGVYRIFVAIAEDFIKCHGFSNEQLRVSVEEPVSSSEAKSRFKVTFVSSIAPVRPRKEHAPFYFGIHGTELLRHLCEELLNKSPSLLAEVYRPRDGGKSVGRFEQFIEMNCPDWVHILKAGR